MTPESASERLLAVARKAPVIPVLVIGDASRAKGLAEALVLLLARGEGLADDEPLEG